jgi:hypothetical protein
LAEHPAPRLCAFAFNLLPVNSICENLRHLRMKLFVGFRAKRGERQLTVLICENEKFAEERQERQELKLIKFLL